MNAVPSLVQKFAPHLDPICVYTGSQLDFGTYVEKVRTFCICRLPSTTVVKEEEKPCGVCSDRDERELGVCVAKRTKRGDEEEREVLLQAEQKKAVALRED